MQCIGIHSCLRLWRLDERKEIKVGLEICEAFSCTIFEGEGGCACFAFSSLAHYPDTCVRVIVSGGSQNLVMEVKFPSKHLEVLWSSDNGTYHLVRTKGPGSTTIEGRFQGFRTPVSNGLP